MTRRDSPSQRILSLWLPRLSSDRIVRQGSPDAADGRPLVVFGGGNNVDLLVAVNEAAERLDLRPGMALAQARAMHPALAAVPHDPAADARLLAAIAGSCQRATPLVAIDPPDTVLLDISGCAHLFGGEGLLFDDVTARLARQGFAVQGAIASTIGAAWAGAHFAAGAVCPAGAERDFIVPLPPAALRLPPGTAAALHRLGLKRIGDILDMPRTPLAARFGAAVLRQLDRALGNENEPLTPLLPVAPYVAEQSCPEPVVREEAVLALVERLAGRLRTAMERRGEGARKVELALFRTDGAVKRVAVATSLPTRDPRAIRALFVERLAALADEIDPGFGYDLIRLSAQIAEPCFERQLGLAETADAEALDRLVDRLSARLGRRRVTRMIAQDSHAPELAVHAVPAQTAAAPDWDSYRRFRAEADVAPRPLRLLARPEPIEDVFAGVPDGPPLRFRWRRVLHEVIAAEGPERIAGAWWNEADGAACDYFRVEDRNGLRYWLFRAGLYRDMTPGCPPRWFMHGMYA